MKFFSSRLRHALKRCPLTQVEIAAAVGITQPYLSDLKSGKKTNPSSQVISNLAKTLGVSADWLIADSPPGEVSSSDTPAQAGNHPAPEHNWEALFSSLLDQGDIPWLLDRIESLTKSAAAGDATAAVAVPRAISRLRARIAELQEAQNSQP